MLINTKHLDPSHLKELASFIYCKQIHSNSTFFNYNIAKIARKSGLSSTLIRNHLAIWKKNNWVRIINNNLTLVSLHKLEKKGLRLECDFKGKSYKEILLHLKKIILKHKQSQCIWTSQIAADLNNPSDLISYKKALRASKKFGIKLNTNGERQKQLRISLNSIGKLIGKSKSSASYLLKQLKKNGLVEVFNDGPKTLYTKVSKHAWKAVRDIHNNTYWYKGLIIQSPCNTYNFL